MNDEQGGRFVIGINNAYNTGWTYPNAAVRMTANLAEQIQYVRGW